MFNHCEKVQTLDVSEWKVSNVTNFHMTFQQCWALKELDVSNWNTGKGTDMGWMFYGCRNLEVIDISQWNVSNVTVMSHMFADCNKVKELKVDNWNVSKLQSLDATFNDCDSLTTINVSQWNTANVREFSQIFDGCDNLAQIIGLENWNTTNGKVFDEMFNACKSLKVLNLSSFDTRNVTPGFKNVNGDLCKGFSSTFAGMNSVEKIILGPNFRFGGNGQVAEQYQPKFPNPAPIDGQATKWYNAANDTYYTAAEIPEPNGETVTYVAAIPPVNP
jgi:surface protein